MNPDAPVITVDGPSGVGKGMVSRALAQKLGWPRLDSGALYRILALAAVDAGIPLDDAGGIAARAATLDIRFAGATEEDECILVDGLDRTAQIRAEATGGLASKIASLPAVRAALMQRQRAFRVAPGLIADGRDMGTVVFADAPVKLFMDASPEERARRRAAQLSHAGQTAIVADLLKEICARDERDRNRKAAPLVPAADAILIDTTTLSPSQVLARVDEILRRKGLEK